jgi:GTP cyclohydrolase II
MPEQLAAATVRRQVSVPLRFADGYAAPARLFTFAGLVDGREHLAIGLGDRSQPWPGAGGSDGSGGSERPPLVRPHSECLTGDVLGSQRCDCGAQLREAVERISEWGGYLLYLRQEGRGIGLYAKLDAYALQDAGLDTYEANVALGYPADQRSYAVAAQMLHALGETQVLLLTNNPMKEVELVRWGVSISERVPTGVHLSPANARYLSAKVRRGAHALDLPSTEPS